MSDLAGQCYTIAYTNDIQILARSGQQSVSNITTYHIDRIPQLCRRLADNLEYFAFLLLNLKYLLSAMIKRNLLIVSVCWVRMGSVGLGLIFHV